MFGGIEAGGTKFICGIGTGPHDIRTAQFPTSTPDITLGQVIDFFKAEAGGSLLAVGIGSFGPLDLDISSPAFGRITSTPKAGWKNYDLLGAIRSGLSVPATLDTDVNTALLGEAKWGAARGFSEAVYLTVGTGVGGGALAHGKVIHGLMHPEMGHLRIPHDTVRDPYPGCCPFHGDCLEGLACGPAMQSRWGMPAGVLNPDHPAWALEAHYLALGLVNLTVTLSPQRILVGGGVMQQAHLFALIRQEFAHLMNGYIGRDELLNHLDRYIQPPQLRDRAGVLGAIALAEQVLSATDAQTGGPA